MKTNMQMAIQEARKTMRKNIGGPFGAVIVKNGEVIAVSSNTVLRDCDPTAHAEVNAIRKAGEVLGTHDLADCILYATGHPCPMCLGAIIWANIKTCYFGCTPQDADKIGFRDDYIYKFINDNLSDEKILNLKEFEREECLKLFEEYSNQNKQIY